MSPLPLWRRTGDPRVRPIKVAWHTVAHRVIHEFRDVLDSPSSTSVSKSDVDLRQARGSCCLLI